MADQDTLNDVFLHAAHSNNPSAMLWRDPHGAWHPISSHELDRRVRAVASALESWGIAKGDRVGIISENRWEWAVTDFGILALGAVDVPIYPTLNAESSAFMLRDSGARILFVSTRAQYDKIAAVRHDTMLERIVVMEDQPAEAAVLFKDLLQTPASIPDGSKAIDSRFNDRLRQVRPGDLATIIYTSGTTGRPKGVELTHGNIAANIAPTTGPVDWRRGDLSISFLPLSHIYERMIDYALMSQDVTVAYCPAFDLVPQAIREVRPTIFVTVPRGYEKIRQTVEQRAAAPGIKKQLFRWALAAGKQHRQAILAGQSISSLRWRLAHKLVLSKIHAAAFGGRLRYATSGGAPLGVETASWFADIGLRIFEGYGLTETSPVISFNTQDAHRIGSVGKVLSNLEYRIAEDGELLVKGPSVFSRYWKNPEATREAFTADGFFRTGDIARIDSDGFLFITDRKKELLKTSGGKLVAPQSIEGKLKANLLVGHAALVGDRRKFVSVLLSPNLAALEVWARQQGISTADRSALVADPRVIAEYQRIVDQVNSTLSSFETMKRMHVVGEEWSLDGGELTPSLKLKRRVVTERYVAVIDSFYAGENVPQRQPV